jgi:hypothetical protein
MYNNLLYVNSKYGIQTRILESIFELSRTPHAFGVSNIDMAWNEDNQCWYATHDTNINMFFSPNKEFGHRNRSYKYIDVNVN